MNVELLGLSNEEFIQWSVINGCTQESEMRELFPIMKSYCDKHVISIAHYIEHFVRLTQCGYSNSEGMLLVQKLWGDRCVL